VLGPATSHSDGALSGWPGLVMAELGRFLLVAGLLLAAVGLLLVVWPKVPGASWVGRLPGDIYIDRPNFKVNVPLGTCLLASLALTMILYLFRR